MRTTLTSLFFSLALVAAHAGAGETLQWSALTGQVKEGRLFDSTNAWDGRISGPLTIAESGPTRSFDFRGATTVSLGDAAAAVRKLPAEEFSVSGWFLVREPQAFGGLIGLVQDNGDSEQGWMLGYNDSHYTFTLAATGSDDGNGKLTYLPAKVPLRPFRWTHVAATYDGRAMKLYVNGELSASSEAQSGKILYPAKGTFVLGGFVDENERNPLDGAIRNVAIRGAVLTAEEIGVEFAAAKELTEYVSPEETELKFIVKPYLQFVTTDSIVVMCETNRPAKVAVEYGVRLPYSDKAVGDASPIAEVKLTGLKPATHYLYRVVATGEDGAKCESPTYSFSTAVEDGTPFAFTVIGDTQDQPDVCHDIAEACFKLRPQFQINAGDVVGIGPDKREWVNEYFASSETLISRVPVFPVLGNHERDAHWYYKYFSLPSPEYYYTFHYGNAQFFLIDTNRNVLPDSEQYRWLDKQLGESKAQWKFVVHHHPIYTSDNNDYGDTMKEPSIWGEAQHRPLADLYDRHHVDVVINGHVHVYERSWPIRGGKAVQEGAGGVRYLTLGGSGGYLEDFAAQRSPYTEMLLRDHHYGFFTINGGTLAFKAFDRSGRLFDSFRVEKPADRGPHVTSTSDAP